MYKSGEKKTNSKVNVIIISVAAAVAVIAAVIIFVCVSGMSKPANSSIAVYRTGGVTGVRIDNLEAVISESTAAGFKCDSDNGRVFYTVESSYSDGLYDLYYIEKKRSEITSPKIIDIGVSGNYSVVSGKLYYMKKNFSAGAFEGTVCDIDSNKIKTFSDNVESIYALQNSETVYFVKMHGDNRVLYKYAEDTASEICRDLMNIRCYNDDENPHIFYEKKSLIHTGMTELYILTSNGEIEMICDNAYTVMYDNYSVGGNLYYFTSSSESISWSYVIADEYSESDKSVEKPKRTDFFAFLGISAEYNAALKLYQDKLVRDEIRAALNESVENGEFSVPVFNAFAYNSQGIYKIAENIDPKNVYSVSSYGDPKIVFESTEVLASDTDMGTLVEIAQRSTMAEVIKYARTVVSESVKSNGMAYAAYGSEGAVMYPLEGYDKTRTLFSFSRDGGRIFAFVRDTQGDRLSLYTNSIGAELKPSGIIGVDTGISGYRFSDEGVIYLKSDADKITGDVYSYCGEKSVKLSNAVNAFTVENFEDVIVLKNNDASSPKQTADYFICVDGEEKLIGSDIVVESFSYTEDGKAAYITSDGKLYIFGKDKAEPVCENVSEILLFA
ncbi:MAG: hypothetical protein IKU08_04825 [Clostridia bacterium]|nr:hypothetical protein [Clostridia bacterium]